MKVGSFVDMLRIESEAGVIYPVLIRDGADAVLVDAGYPGQLELFRQAIGEAGADLGNISQIILTHQDLDHIGCVLDIKAQSHAQVLAHRLETPYIDGREKPIKLAEREARYDSLPEEERQFLAVIREGFKNRRFSIDRELEDGDVLPVAGGIEIVHTPGHTPGHICLYLHEGGILITGDALNVYGGKLTGPSRRFTKDMPQAFESLKKLERYDIRSVIAYHGGLYEGGIKADLREIIRAGADL